MCVSAVECIGVRYDMKTKLNVNFPRKKRKEGLFNERTGVRVGVDQLSK